jgi:regulator of sigma E protease
VFGKFRGTEFRLSPILAGGYVSIPELEDETDPAQRKYFAVWKRIAVAVAGVAYNFVFAVLLLSGYYIFAGEPNVIVRIDQLSTELPIARDAGLMPHDEFVSVDHVSVHSPLEVTKALCAARGGAADVLVMRAGKPVTVMISPDPNCHIGVSLKSVVNGSLTVSPLRAVSDATKTTGTMVGKIAEGTGMLVGVVSRPPEIPESALEMRGIVGIIQMGAAQMNNGIFGLIMFNVVISASLIFMNMLPFPVLDGGHVVFFFLEGITGKPVNDKLKKWLFNFFYYFLIFLMAYGLYNDFRHIWLGH